MLLPVEPAPVQPAPMAPLPRRPWGFWATLGFGVAVAMVFFVLAIITAGVFFGMVSAGELLPPDQLEASAIEQNGLFFSLIFVTGAPLCTGLIVLCAWLRRRRYSLTEYLGLSHPGWARVFLWVGISVLLVAGLDSLTYVLGRPVVPTSMTDMYKTSVFPPLLALVIVVIGPMFEEFFFRGFLLEGFRRSFMGTVAAILVTSALWAALHTQYDWYGMSQIFVGGLVLSAARLHTNCIWVCFAMHAVQNLVATAETVVVVHFLS